MLIGDPPRRVVRRMLRAAVKPFARCRYFAHYNMNVSTPRSRAAFLARIAMEMSRL